MKQSAKNNTVLAMNRDNNKELLSNYIIIFTIIT